MIHENFYMHDSDQKALVALKAIPGFSQVLKAFMAVWDEKLFRIENLSCNLRINENQLSKYYEMLPPICEKLGIEVPELYLTLDVQPNAWTFGDEKPAIVMTSGLIETLPEHLIPTVLAHECGHIACHHCLYTMMGRIILNNGIAFLSLPDVAIYPIQVAYAYWMRCSEFSADRAAALCDGTSDHVFEMCLRFSGFDKDISGEINRDEFMAQALEYQALVNDSVINKSFEIFQFGRASHPLNAVRALDVFNWAQTERFEKMLAFSTSCNNKDEMSASRFLGERPITNSSKYYLGKNKDAVVAELLDLGFENIQTEKIKEKGTLTKEGQVLSIQMNGCNTFEMYSWYDLDTEIIVQYYEAETEAEVAAAHPGQRRTPFSSKKCKGAEYTVIAEAFREAGFATIETLEQRKDKKGLLDKNNSIFSVSINGQAQFEKGEWFDEKAVIKIVFLSFAEKPKK